MEDENITIVGVQDETPVPAPTTPMVTSNDKSSGALIGTIIVIVVLVVGGFYLWNTKVQPMIEQKNTPPIESVASDETSKTTIEQLSSQATSDETSSIQSDLSATDMSGLDKDLQAI